MNKQIDFGPANIAQISQEEKWNLVLTRAYSHPPEAVWAALTEPDQLKEWAPYDASGSLDEEGSQVVLTTFEAQGDLNSETIIELADRPKLLQFSWGGMPLRWELTPQPEGTLLSLWTKIDTQYVAMGAAGWHMCLVTFGFHLDGVPIGRHAGQHLLNDPDWQWLHAEYKQKFKTSPDDEPLA